MSTASAQKVLVLGGTGFLGTSLCRALTEAHVAPVQVTVATRKAQTAEHLLDLDRLAVAEVDIFDAERLTELVGRHDAVVNLVAVLHGDPAKFHRVHVELVEKVVRACNETGKSRVIHVSALGAGIDAPSFYLRSKAEGEARLRDGNLSTTIFRPSVIFGENDRFLNLFASLLKWAPLLPLAGAHAQFQPVWVEDVASAIVRCLRLPQSIGRTYECVGPKVYELIELVRLVGEWSGHRRPIVPLPRWLGQMQALMLESMPGDPLMSRDNLNSMLRANVATGLPTLRELGIGPVALDVVAPRYLGPLRPTL